MASKHCRKLVGFTLIEVVLAIGLCGAVMALLTTAINLYLVRVDSNRTRVESSQLARMLLTQIGNDLRAVRFVTPNSSGMGAGGMGVGNTQGPSSSAGPAMGGGSLGVDPATMGIFGTSTELRIDRSASHAWDPGLFESVQMLGESASPREMPQTVIYFFNEGRPLTAEEFSAGGVVDQQSLAAYEGLARQKMPTAAWLAMNSSAAGQFSTMIQSNWNPSNTELLAPEVIELAFSYFDGIEWYPEWDTALMGGVPLAIEIRLKILVEAPEVLVSLNKMERDSLRRDPNRSLEYRLLVHIPQVQPIPTLSPLQAPGGGFNQAGGLGPSEGDVP